jgi:hypothetical protein
MRSAAVFNSYSIKLFTSSYCDRISCLNLFAICLGELCHFALALLTFASRILPPIHLIPFAAHHSGTERCTAHLTGAPYPVRCSHVSWLSAAVPCGGKILYSTIMMCAD